MDSLAEESDLLGPVHARGAAEDDLREEARHGYGKGATAGEGELHSILGRDEGDDGAEDVAVEVEEGARGEAAHEIGGAKEEDICWNWEAI